MIEFLFATISAFLVLWSIILLISSFEVDDPKIFWTQRALALLFLIGAMTTVAIL